MKVDLHTLQEHLVFQRGSGYSIFSFLCGFLLTIVCLLLPFSSGHCVVCPSSIFGGFWLPLWYLQTFIRYRKTGHDLTDNSIWGCVCYCLIGCFLTCTGKYCIHNHKSNNIYKLYTNEWGLSQTFDGHLENMDSWVGTKKMAYRFWKFTKVLKIFKDHATAPAV